MHPGRTATYQVDRNINYTNVCVYRCSFCAFYRKAGDAEAYVLPFEEIGAKIEETLALGGTGVLLQGGVHAELPFSFYEELLRFLRERYPRIHRHAFSAPEIYFLAKKEKLPVRDVLARLRDAGLHVDPGRRRRDPRGRRAEADLVARRRRRPRSGSRSTARRTGSACATTATMMFGVGETYAERVEHLAVVRRAPGRVARRADFTAFIPWTFQEENTALDGRSRSSTRLRLPEDARGLAPLPRQRPRTCRARG